MRDQPSPTARAASASSEVLVPGVLEAMVRAVAGALSSADAQSAETAHRSSERPLLDLEETAELLGVSRMTVARMADEGRLPSVVVRRGRVQKTRRIPRAFVERMVADACAGAQVDMAEYATAWLAEHAHPPGATARHGNQEPVAFDMTVPWPAGGAHDGDARDSSKSRVVFSLAGGPVAGVRGGGLGRCGVSRL